MEATAKKTMTYTYTVTMTDKEADMIMGSIRELIRADKYQPQTYFSDEQIRNLTNLGDALLEARKNV